MTLTAAREALLQASDVLLITHQRGDADSASAYALALALVRHGARVAVWHDLPNSLGWLIPRQTFCAAHELQTPVVVALDTGNYARLALPHEKRGQIAQAVDSHGSEDCVPTAAWRDIQPIDVVIDHHASNPGYATLNWIDPEASSTAEMLVSLLQNLEQAWGSEVFTPDIVRQLFTGIVSDTQWFSRDVRTQTYEAAALLEARAQVDKQTLADRLESLTIGQFQLGRALRERLTLAHGVAASWLLRDDLRAAGVPASEGAQLIDDMVRLPADLLLLFVEQNDGSFRVRLRGKTVPVLDLARAFGGGGHEWRAGANASDLQATHALVEAARAAVAQAGEATV
jgi:nanoRNase/pAp phosphatase (c-di-AMP/oligoRNAs hydrolase)